MSEFAPGFRTHGLRTALQVRHTIYTLRKKKIKRWQIHIPKSLKNEDILQFFTTMHGVTNGGGWDGRIPCYTGSKETKANVSCQRKYRLGWWFYCVCVTV
jgi:hypothetical protein